MEQITRHMRKLARKYSLTEGERGILVAYVAVSLFGAGLAFVEVNHLGGRADLIRPLGTWDIWVIFAGFIGASLGLRSAHRWFGQPGLRGLLHAVAGCFSVSFFGSICAGTLALPGYGTMFGPFAMVMLMIENPSLLLFWCAVLATAHVLFLSYRRERASIFPVENDDGIPDDALSGGHRLAV